jgi:hypothetical protein
LAALGPEIHLEETLDATLREYVFNATYPHKEGLVEPPDGELVDISDPDAGGL